MKIRTLLATAAVVLALGTGHYLAEPALAQQNTRPVPVATACTTATTSAQCISANPTRRFIEICNVSNSVIWIAPGTTAAVANAGNSYPLAPVASNLASCYRTPTGAAPGAGSAWQALSVTSAGVLSIFEY